MSLINSPLILASKDPLGHNYDYPILSYNNWAILTNHIVIMIGVTIFMLWFMPWVGRAVAKGKTGTSHDYVTKNPFAHMVEVICVFFRDDIAKPVMGPFTDRFMPLIWTFFFFILFNNLVGMVPLLDITSLTYKTFTSGSDTTLVAHADDTTTNTGEIDTTHAGSEANEPEHAATEGTQEADDLHPNEQSGDADSHGDPVVDTHAETPAGGDDHADAAGGHHEVWKLGPLVAFQDLTQEQPTSHFHGFGGTATGNIAVTFALALISIFFVIFSAIKNLGFGGFLHHLTLDAPVALWPLTIMLEIIGLIAKPFALMVRLFANLTAGHVMLGAIIGFTTMGWNGFVTYMSPEGQGTALAINTKILLIGIAPCAFVCIF